MPKERAYLDACPWIAQYKPGELTQEQKAGIEALYTQVERGTLFLITSSLLLVEALTVSAEVLEIAFDGRKGMFFPADETVCKRARELEHACFKKARRVLAPIDAIHLATASVHNCRRFITMDKKRKDNQLAPIGDREILEPLLGLKIIDPCEIETQGAQAKLIFD